MTAKIATGTAIMIVFVELFSPSSFFSDLLFVVAVVVVVVVVVVASLGFTAPTVVGVVFGVCVVVVSGTQLL